MHQAPLAPDPAKPLRLLRREDFLRVAKGQRRHATAFSLQMNARPPAAGDIAPVARYGFTVTKKIGNAVQRNRIRRRLRAALAGLPTRCSQPGHDYVIVGKREALSLAFDRLQADLRRVIETMGRAPPRAFPSKPTTDQAPHP